MAYQPTNRVGRRGGGQDAIWAMHAAIVYGDRPIGRPATPTEKNERGEKRGGTPGQGLSGLGSQPWNRQDELLAEQAELEDGARRNAQGVFGATITDQRPPVTIERPDGQQAMGGVQATRQRRIPRAPVGRGALLAQADRSTDEARTKMPVKLGVGGVVPFRAQGFGPTTGARIME